MANDSLVKKTGSSDNERLQINRALESIFNTLSRADSWDAAASWGDHAEADYATALSELEAFADFGIPGTPTLVATRETAANGTEVHAINASWSRGGDDEVVYDLEIRESDISFNDTNTSVILANTTLYGVPIVSNDSQDATINYKAFFDADRRYWFRVRFRKNTLVSNWSEFANVTTAQNTNTPSTPTSLLASPIVDGVQLSWDYNYDNDFNVAKIEILRGGVLIASVARPATTYIDEPLNPSTTYSYQVRARTFLGAASGLSNTSSATPNRATVTIRSANPPTTRPDGSALQDGDRWIETDRNDKPYTNVSGAWVAEYTVYDSNNYSEDVAGFKIDQTTGNAEFNNIVAKGQFTAGVESATEDRIELTPTGAYRIWIGKDTKNDGNAIFYVKDDGTAFINKTEFEIGAQPNKGVASGSLTTGITSTSNGVEAEFSQFTSNGQSVLFEIVFSYFAFNNESSPSSCSTLGPSTGVLTLQRKIGAGSYSTITSAGFSIPNTAFLFTDPSVPDECQVATQGEATRSLIDASPPAINDLVQYRVLIDSWNCPLLGAYSITGTVSTNTINAAFTQ